MNEVKIFLTGCKDNLLILLLNDVEVLTLKEWIINDTPTLTMCVESNKNEITLFRSHISCIQYG
ncbi:MAG: hypothetical protein Q8942_11545 [Bacillota bacterium]|nr:hypothetical protein [Bacillota bacterium]